MKSKLEFQADRIERVLAVHKVPARVTGGTVTPRWVNFQVMPAVGAKVSRIRRLSEEIATALDASTCRVSRHGGTVSLEVPRSDPQPVRLMPLFRQLDSEEEGIPPMTAILGLAEDGAPLLIRLPSPDVAHILVSGTTGSGKTALLQTLVLSLAMTNPPINSRGPYERRNAGGLALVLVDPKGSAFRCFAGLPHLARAVIRDTGETVEALESLVRLMERMPVGRSGSQPRVVVVIDELADLMLVSGKALEQSLTRLTQRGREAGIHVVAATQKPTTRVLGPLVKANFPVRLVGKVMSAEDARTASGWSGTGAERLMGRGDFLAVAEGRVLRFQTAYTAPGEIERTVEDLARGGVVVSETSPEGAYQALVPWPVKRLAGVLRRGA